MTAMTPLEHLVRLERAHGIERETPKRMLERARDVQSRLEELAEKHSCELSGWIDLAMTLEDRRTRAGEAVDRVLTETMELDDAVFGALSKADCLEILRSLKNEFARALDTRCACAQTLVAIAQAYREEGYAVREAIENALRSARSEVMRQAKAPEAVAAEYVARLAEFCGVPPSSGGAGRGDRFPDLTAIFNTESGATFEEIANRMQRKALGLWSVAVSPKEGKMKTD